MHERREDRFEGLTQTSGKFARDTCLAHRRLFLAPVGGQPGSCLGRGRSSLPEPSKLVWGRRTRGTLRIPDHGCRFYAPPGNQLLLGSRERQASLPQDQRGKQPLDASLEGCQPPAIAVGADAPHLHVGLFRVPNAVSQPVLHGGRAEPLLHQSSNPERDGVLARQRRPAAEDAPSLLVHAQRAARRKRPVAPRAAPVQLSTALRPEATQRTRRAAAVWAQGTRGSSLESHRPGGPACRAFV